MTVSDWEGTSWSGTIPESRSLVIPPPMGMATVTGKAAFGAGVSVYETGTPLSDYRRSPRRIMRDAQAAYRTHTWIRVAERAVTRKVAGLPWHLEDDNDDEVDDELTDPLGRAIRDLLEQPQAKLPAQERQPGINSWRGLVSITSRHMGLCNLGHWYFDGKDLTTGIPNAILYINPARMEPGSTTNGRLTHWLLDADIDGRNGVRLELDEVLTFYLDPPDTGFQGSGLYEAVLLKSRVASIADQHAAYVLGTGGRIPGIIAPKEGYIDNDETFGALVREFRNVNEAQDAAKRTTILRGPVEYTKTGGDSQELSLVELSKMNREDILSTWGVPASQAPIAMAAGLNSGETKGYDEAVLMQGSVHDRVVAIRETIQYGLLDRLPTVLELLIEEPEFDDETPAYERASKSSSIAMMRNERRAIVGLDPLPDYDPVSGEPLGIAIDLPVLSTVVGVGPSEETRPTPAPILPEPVLIPAVAPGKATLPQARGRLVAKFEPQVRKAVTGFLDEQRSAIAAAIRSKAAHLTKRPKDRDAWWDAKRWDQALTETLRGSAMGLAQATATVVGTKVRPAKAMPFEDSVLRAVLRSVGLRISQINDTTRDLIATLIGKGFEDGLAPGQIADLIEDSTPFDAARAELIARTETALVYNEAALTSYNELGVERVEAIDGDEDEECAQRNGQTYSLDEAMLIEDHPNGTLDWLPVVPGKADAGFEVALKAIEALASRPEPVVNVQMPRGPMRTILQFDTDGNVTGSYEEPIE